MFSDQQLSQLRAALDQKRVKPPAKGKYGEYIQAWDVIDHANKIFGFDGWDRETLEMEELSVDPITLSKGGNNERPGFSASYRAKSRVTVRAGDTTVIREGTGDGTGVGNTPGEAKISAIKEAESDAMKRALMTFGNQFGLTLYNKDKGAREIDDGSELAKARLRKQADSDENWKLLAKAMRDMCEGPQQVRNWWIKNQKSDLFAAIPDELGKWFFEWEVKPFHDELEDEKGAAA